MPIHRSLPAKEMFLYTLVEQFPQFVRHVCNVQGSLRALAIHKRFIALNRHDDEPGLAVFRDRDRRKRRSGPQIGDVSRKIFGLKLFHGDSQFLRLIQNIQIFLIICESRSQKCHAGRRCG